MSRPKFAVLLCALMLFAINVSSAETFSVNPTPGFGKSPFNPPIGGPETVNYQYDDGTIEDGIGITGTNPFDIIWLNVFPVQAGGERITHISASFGSPVDTRPYDGLPATILLYNDPNGGSTTDATLVQSFNTTVTNANTGILNTYDIPDTVVSGNLIAGVLMRNLPGGNAFVASIDQTPPNTSGVSFAGFTIGAPLNEANLGSIPAGQYGTIEGFGLPGNWAVRAVGEPVPEPVAMGLVSAIVGFFLLRRFR